MNTSAPIILREGKHTESDVKDIRKREVLKTLDVFEDQLKELYEVMHPDLKFSGDYEKRVGAFVEKRVQKKSAGDWIYYPWSKILLHTVNEKEHNLLRTNRNKNIITSDEQQKLIDFTVGIVGLSIGNAMAVTMAYTGIGNTMKIADFDTLETTNLNRIRSGLQYLSSSKIDITCQQIYEINPYANLITYPKGLKVETLKDCVFGDPKPQIIFEAIDDFEMKVRVRMAAREARIPLIMLTNLGDNLLIDVERYDLDPKTPLFNGLVGNAAEYILSGSISEEDKQRYAVQLVGRENIPERVFESVQEVGKSLAGRPQLMSTVTVGGGVAAMVARKIALKGPLSSGRKLIRLGDIL